VLRLHRRHEVPQVLRLRQRHEVPQVLPLRFRAERRHHHRVPKLH
jgi:hypothetical protein